jgi:hypothetical protein
MDDLNNKPCDVLHCNGDRRQLYHAKHLKSGGIGSGSSSNNF